MNLILKEQQEAGFVMSKEYEARLNGAEMEVMQVGKDLTQNTADKNQEQATLLQVSPLSRS